MDDYERYYEICKNRFDRIDEALIRLDEAVRGTTDESINTRVARLETRAKLLWLVAGLVVVQIISGILGL